MKRPVIFFILVLAMALSANAQTWYENFDSYVDGSQIVGQGGWEEWAPNNGGFVSSDFSRSNPHSLKIISTSDVVRQYGGYNYGKWMYKTHLYIPTGYSGMSYFILLNTYDKPSATYNWSVQVGFDATTGAVDADCGSSNPVQDVYFKLDTWMEIKVMIHLDLDWVQIYLDGELLDDPSLLDHPTLGGGYKWTMGVFGNGGGVANLAAVDLYGNSATDVYYDDFSLEPYIPPLACDVTTISEKGGTANFTLDAGTNCANRNYVLFAGITGTYPGTPFPGGYITLPINWDIFTNIAISLANTALFVDFMGTLDANGQGTAALNLPAVTNAVGFKMYFAYALGLPLPWDYASNAVMIEVVP